MTTRENGPRDREQVTVPAEIVRAACTRWPDRGPAWATSVNDGLDELCRRYQVQTVKVMDARYGFVVSVRAAGDRLLVLKSTPDPAGALQASAAEQLAELGIGPTVHEVVESDVGTWTVMDQVQPGTRAAGSSSLEELASLLRPLVAASPPARALPPISEWLRQRLRNGGLTDLPPGVAPASSDERARALSTLDDLVADEARSLCHGDPSGGNVLRGSRGLQLVDPRGVSGDVEYDAAVLALKTGQQVAALARQTGIDVARVKAWGSVAIAARV
ncbi:phosphotransferase [Amycolatopsis sp. K13G38]|uniref:Phosphotransferase n=1 Tax=Amycolatopsis acididurans TaxID=2724524 RepID=A0ABX1JBE9_9PSEU|nr:phosphotransferase [Amycolatopsis acididurans]NKQ57120.1 phosphotransferase [Amycolatopsis acididurans]